LGLIAADGGFAGVAGDPDGFEYWSFGKDKGSDTGFGYVSEPVKEGRKPSGLPRDEFLSRTEDYLREAIGTWIRGDAPFTARLNPDIGGYNDFDQLMRLDEWQARSEDGA
jgi:ATP-dependent helicase/nuclease subunit B